MAKHIHIHVGTAKARDAGLFSEAQIERLRSGYSKIKTINPDSPTYKEPVGKLDQMSQPQLKQIIDARIAWLSSLARNRLPGSTR